MSLVIRDVEASAPDASLLMHALDEDLHARYPGASILGIDAAGFADSGGIFLVGYEDGVPVACGALRPRLDGSFEVKRMFVHADARRRGYARAILRALESRAHARGATLVRLETGDGQPEAVRLYQSCGYTPVPCFGEYDGSPHSRCFQKRLTPLDRVP